MAFVVVFLCIFNVIMWIVFLKKFKKLFTTDDTIENAREQMNKILTDLNNQTARNISLIEDRCAKLKALNAEADKKLKLLNEMESKNLSLSAFQTNVQNISHPGAAASRAADRYAGNMKKKREPVTAVPDYDSAVEITKAGEKIVDNNIQTTLFDEAETKAESGLRFEVIQTSPETTEVPVIAPQVIMSDTPVSHKKELKDSIIELYDSGYDIESIAARLSCSANEVQLALTLAARI